jgi:hypothetical protein
MAAKHILRTTNKKDATITVWRGKQSQLLTPSLSVRCVKSTCRKWHSNREKHSRPPQYSGRLDQSACRKIVESRYLSHGRRAFSELISRLVSSIARIMFACPTGFTDLGRTFSPSGYVCAGLVAYDDLDPGSRPPFTVFLQKVFAPIWYSITDHERGTYELAASIIRTEMGARIPANDLGTVTARARVLYQAAVNI